MSVKVWHTRSMRWRKILAAVMFLGCSLFVFTGCGSSKPPADIAVKQVLRETISQAIAGDVRACDHMFVLGQENVQAWLPYSWRFTQMKPQQLRVTCRQAIPLWAQMRTGRQWTPAQVAAVVDKWRLAFQGERVIVVTRDTSPVRWHLGIRNGEWKIFKVDLGYWGVPQPNRQTPKPIWKQQRDAAKRHR